MRIITLRLTLLLVFLRMGFPCFSEEFRRDLKEWQSESLMHIGHGMANLFSHESWHALEDFQRANTLLDPSDNSSFVIGFLVSFGQAIAYDCLGFREQCKQAIGSLFFAINGYDDEESPETSQETDSNSQEYGSSLDLLRNLADIAPSRDVRELLFSLIDEMAEELLPAFQFAKSPLVGENWHFDYGAKNVSITQCKSWWKKFKKWCIKAGQFLHILKEASNDAKQLKQNFDELRSSKQYGNPRYIDPNYKIN